MFNVGPGYVTTCNCCQGGSVERSDVGGLAYGGCDCCNGTGLVLYE